MKIDKIELVNFRGVEGRKSFELPQMAAIVGKNGIGKTSLLTAVRYGLTGEKPDGDIINKKCDECRVEITLTDASGEANTFERIERRDKPNQCKMNGKATTMAALNSAIEEMVGIPLSKLKVLSSAEFVAAMKPSEMTSFILDYIPEEITPETVVGYIPEPTLGMLERVDRAFNGKSMLSIADIDEAEKSFRFDRKETNAGLEGKKQLLATMPSTKPTRSRSDVEADLKELLGVEAEYRVYEAKKNAYAKAEASIKAWEGSMTDVQKKIKDLEEVKKPEANWKDAFVKERRRLMDSRTNQQTSLNAQRNSLNVLENTLKNLSSDMCLVCEGLKCTTDKTCMKGEYEEDIKITKEGIAATEAEIEKTNKSLDEVEEKQEEAEEKARMYERKIALIGQKTSLEKAKPTLPEKPEEMEKPDVAARKAELNAELDRIARYEEGLKLQSQIEQLELASSDLNKLVKAFEAKGPVRSGIVDYYLSAFEELCNEKAEKIHAGCHFTFQNDGGITILMDTGKGSSLPYESLSGGEQAYMLFILMSMLNELSGTGLMMLDELSVLDDETFRALMKLTAESKDEYDHILIAAVDHEDAVKAIADAGIPTLDVTESLIDTSEMPIVA